MENVGFDPSRVHFSIHTDAYNHVKHTQRTASTTVAAPWEQFHEYAMEWTRERIDTFVDGARTFSYVNDGAGWRTWPFDAPQYLLINAAVGASWGRPAGRGPRHLPAALLRGLRPDLPPCLVVSSVRVSTGRSTSGVALRW